MAMMVPPPPFPKSRMAKHQGPAVDDVLFPVLGIGLWPRASETASTGRPGGEVWGYALGVPRGRGGLRRLTHGYRLRSLRSLRSAWPCSLSAT